MDLSTVRGRRRKSLFRPWNSYLAKKGAVEAAALARQLDHNRARAHAGLVPHVTPLVRLTVKLIDTYEGINETYYTNRPAHSLSHPDPVSPSVSHAQAPPPPSNPRAIASPLSIQYYDENFDYIVRTGEMFNNRYMLEKVIGRGSFGQVVRAFDTRENTHVAIKIIKNNSLYVEQALSEVRMTSYLNSIDPDDEHSIMRLRDKFIFRGHQCLVLELLSFSLYDLLRSTEFYGVSLNLVRKFCKQILNCLAFLARPDVNIAHCDLKPENVLLRHSQRSAIKVVDFGASCRISESMFIYVQSRFYRAPEVILGLPYGTQVDVWSLGCMLIELHTGYPVFAGKDEGDQIAIIVERLGLPPASMLERGKKTDQFFDLDVVTGEWFLKPSISEAHGNSQPASKPIRAFVDYHTGTSNGRRKRVSGGHSEEDYEIFLSLADQMLQYDPDDRITAEEALSDSFVRGALCSSRSGRDSPTAIPAGLASVAENVPEELNPGRKAPLQRMGMARENPGILAGTDVGSGGTSDAGSISNDVNYNMRTSKSEPLMEPVGKKKTIAFKQSDWAEEVGIEPPPWRTRESSLRPISEALEWRRGDARRNLGAAGGGQPIERRRRRLGMGGLGSGGSGGGGSCSGGGGGSAVTSMGSRVDECGWDVRRASEVFAFGLGSGPVAVAVRAAALEEERGIGYRRGLNPALPRGHGNALLLFTG